MAGEQDPLLQNHETSTTNDRHIANSRLSLLWFGLSIVVLLLMLAHESDAPQFLQRYSTRYVTLLGSMGMMTLLAGVNLALVRMNWLPSITFPNIPYLGVMLTVVGCVAIALIQFVIRVSFQPGPTLFPLYLSALSIGILLWLLFVTNRAQQLLPWWVMWVLLGIIILIVIAQITLYLGNLPALRYVDEASRFSRAYSYVNFGRRNYGTLMPFRSVPLNIPIISVLDGLWMSVFGANIQQARLFLLLLGYLGVVIAAITAGRLYGRRAAMAGVCIGLFVPLLHNYMRPDIAMPALIGIGLYFYFAARRTEAIIACLWRNVVVGLALGFTIEAHVYGLSFIVAFGLVYLLLMWRNVRQGKSILQALIPMIGYMIGGLIYGAFFVVFRIPADLTSLSQLSLALGDKYAAESTIGGNLSLIERFTVLPPEFYAGYLTRSGIELLVLLFGLGSAVWRLRTGRSRQPEVDQTLLIIWVVSAVGLTALLAHMNVYYWIYNLPFVVILGGAALAQLNDTVRDQSLRLGTLAGTLAVATAFTFYIPRQAESVANQSVFPLIEIGREVAAMLPENAVILGRETYYLGMPENPNYFAISDFELHPITAVSPPRAVIFTLGQDDDNQPVWDYVDQENFQLARCFSTSHFGGMIALYVESSLLPANAPIDCNDWQRPGT